MNEKVVFMGTPQFASEILKTLISEKYDIIAVVTQPDKVVGRKQQLVFSEVKQVALDHSISVYQPIKIRKEFQEIIDLQPDLILTCAYGQIIPVELLKAPRCGCINIHASLLPKLRGGAPIQHAIIDGYNQTGITIMEMAEKMDNGNIITQSTVEISNEDTYRSLHDKLIPVAQKLIIETLPSILAKSYKAIVQDENEVTFGYNISREQERINLTYSYQNVYNQIRGLIDNPCGYIVVNDKTIKLCDVATTDISDARENGTLVFVNKALGLVIDHRIILIRQVQPEGKKPMTAKEFINGAGRNFDGVICQ